MDMSILDDLKARVSSQTSAVREAVEAKRRQESEEHSRKQRERLARKTLAAAANVEENGASESVDDLVGFIRLGREMESNLRRAEQIGNDQFASELRDTTAEIEREIDACSGEDGFLKFLASIKLAAEDQPTIGALLHFAEEAKGMGLVGVIPEMEARERSSRMHAAREAGERLSPEAARPVWILQDPRENSFVCYITIWCDSETESTRIARIRAFSKYFGELVRAVKTAREGRRAEARELDERVDLETARMFERGAEGFVKLTGISRETPWKFTNRDGEEISLYGSLYAEVNCGRLALVLPERSPLRKSCEILGLVDSDRSGKRLTFGPGFSNLQALSGPPIPWQKIAQARAFLCLAAGIKPASGNGNGGNGNHEGDE